MKPGHSASQYSYRLRTLAALALLWSSGCGGFVVEDGIFPLPVIHWLFATPADANLAYETVQTQSSNGQIIHGWFVPSEGAAATILFHHGALLNRSIYIDHVEMFHNLGCHVLIMDYQGFGENVAPARLSNVLDDANAALEYLRTRTEPGTDRIVLYGVSMGTMPALAQGAAAPDGVLGVIVEGVVQQRRLTDWGYFVLGILPSPEAFDRIPAELDPFAHVGNVSLPKMFIQSREDIITPFVGAEELYELAAEPKMLVETIGFHGTSIGADAKYIDHMRNFLEETTR